MTERPLPSSEGVTGRMSRQRRRDTDPGVAIRRLLHRRGLRYRVDAPIQGLARRGANI